MGAFITNAQRSGLWKDAKKVHRSAITKAKKKISWNAFEALHKQAVSISQDIWPDRPEFKWRGMSVIAFDGAKYQLPATKEIRDHFDPTSGLDNRQHGRGHYPLCLVSTAYDVFRRIPLARTVVANSQSNKRDEAIKLIGQVPSNSVLVFDRGYPSYELFHHLESEYDGFYLFRSKTARTFSAVEEFIKSNKKEGVIEITPGKRYQTKVGFEVYRHLNPIRLRVILMTSPSGEQTVLLTNLNNTKQFPRKEIVQLYLRRWEIETYYRDEKTQMKVEQFHSRSVNGVLQELFAIATMQVIARTIAIVSALPQQTEKCVAYPQFKHAITTLSNNAAILTATDSALAYEVLTEILCEMKRVKYYRPKIPKPTQPRVSKAPQNKWRDSKRRKIREG